jgi:cysteine desulfurase
VNRISWFLDHVEFGVRTSTVVGARRQSMNIDGRSVEVCVLILTLLLDLMRVAYFDHAATTSVYPEVVEAMLPWLGGQFGNPSGVHQLAREARAGIDSARDQFAAIVGAQPREVVFTGGGTEAINLALGGVIDHLLRERAPDGSSSLKLRKPIVAWSAVEHDAVRSWVAARSRSDVDQIVLPVTRNGVLDLGAADELLHSEVSVVAVMAVNNEVGTVQPIVALREIILRRCPNALLVVDAVQALTWIDVQSLVAVADLVAFSGHKIGAPKGVGALIIREGTPIDPILHGGGQERDRRSGTQNVAGIVALGLAAAMTNAQREANIARVGRLRDRLVDGIVGSVAGVYETVSRDHKNAGNAHLCVAGIESEELLILLDNDGICASAGSACASGALHLSPVLLAMGVDRAVAGGALRLTLGPSSSDADVDLALQCVPRAIAKLR